MKLSAVESSRERIRLHCPLAPNVNHHQTAFGGSLSTTLMLAGWAMMRVRMGADGLLNGAGAEWAAMTCDDAGKPTDQVRLVVSKSATDFLQPVATDFETECRFQDDVQWSRFLERFEHNHWAKLHLQSSVVIGTSVFARMKATFVAIRGGGPAERLAD